MSKKPLTVHLKFAQTTLKQINRQLKKIEKIEIGCRGSLDNERFVKLTVERKNVIKAINRIKNKMKKEKKCKTKEANGSP